MNDFWQENKRFVLGVAGGVVVFFTSVLLIDNVFGADLADQERRKSKAEATLAGPLYQQTDLDRLREEHKALLAAHEALAQASVFQPRPEFAPVEGSMANRYFEVVDATRQALLPAAGRAGMPVPDNLGLPAVAPLKDEHSVRILEGLDIVDRTLRLAIEAGIGRVEALEIGLDPNLRSGKPLEGIEKTPVQFKLRGNAAALTRLALMLVRSKETRVGVLERAEFTSGGAREDDARLELTIVAVRIHQPKPDDEAAPKSKPAKGKKH